MFDLIALVCFRYVLLLLLFRTQATMTTLQELYNFERQKMVKDVALLKQLKAQISEVQVMTAQLQQAEADEHWEDYERLLPQLTQLTSRHAYPTLAVASATVNVPQATAKINVPPKNSEITLSNDDFEPEPKMTSTTNNPTEAIASDDDFEIVPTTTDLTNTPAEQTNSDDDFLMPATNEAAHHETVTDLQRGDIFASVTELQSKLQEHAQAYKFKIRREKDSIVCANAGCSNWTGITNYKARAKQALHRNQKRHDAKCAILDDNLDNSIEELLQTEEEKVGPQLTVPFQHTLTLFF
jgi:hypothetical protein